MLNEGIKERNRLGSEHINDPLPQVGQVSAVNNRLLTVFFCMILVIANAQSIRGIFQFRPTAPFRAVNLGRTGFDGD